jgi:hypothetical protein
MNPDHIAWCKRMFAMMAEGGIWGVPRSGLIFTRRGDKLVNTQRMPFLPGMENPDMDCPHTAEALAAHQEDDFQEHVRHFGAAGITVEKELP